MSKGDLVGKAAKVVETQKADQVAVDSVFTSIEQALKNEVAVTLIGFGTFKVAKTPARIGKTQRPVRKYPSKPERFRNSFRERP